MSANAFGSEWSQLEAGTFRFRDPLNKERRLIPLRLDNTPIKGVLAQSLYLTWHHEKSKQEYSKLIEACRNQRQLSDFPGSSESLVTSQSMVATIFFDVRNKLSLIGGELRGKIDWEGIDDALFHNAGNEYSRIVETRYNLIRVFGMDRPIPLRDIYVRVNILTEITASRRLTVKELEHDFDFDKRGFGSSRSNLNGSELVTRSTYRINTAVKKALLSIIPPESQLKVAPLLKNLELTSFENADSFLSKVIEVTPVKLNADLKENLAFFAHEPPPNHIVLGKPGAGKTTFLKYLALYVLDGKTRFNRIPLFVTLRDFAESKLDLFSFILRDIEPINLPESRKLIEASLKMGRAVVLLDGLDEVVSLQQDNVIKSIIHFSKTYRKTQIIVSCRVAAYNHWFSDFYDIEIADFSSAQISTFVTNWFKYEPETAINCMNNIKAKRQTMELASNPLLLTLLCIAYDQSLGFPRNRAELYREAIDALLRKWDSTRRVKRDDLYKNLSTMRKESMLCRLASETFERGQYFIPQRALEIIISKFISNLPNVDSDNVETDCEAVIKTIEAQHGFLVERARGIYSFSHLTFQEYFTAKHYIDSSKESIDRSFITKCIGNPKWREVCLLTCGLMAEADDFFRCFKKEVDKIIQNTPACDILVEIARLANPVPPKGKSLKVCLLLIYTVHHAQAVHQGQVRSEFQNCLDSLFVMASSLDSGTFNKFGSHFYLEQAKTLAIETDFIRHLADNPVFQLKHILKSSRSIKLNKIEVENLFPIDVLTKYGGACALMLECLVSDCYVDKRLRQQLMYGALSVE